MKVTANELHLPDNDNNDASFANKSEGKKLLAGSPISIPLNSRKV